MSGLSEQVGVLIFRKKAKAGKACNPITLHPIQKIKNYKGT